jgi:hypothetical protein
MSSGLTELHLNMMRRQMVARGLVYPQRLSRLTYTAPVFSLLVNNLPRTPSCVPSMCMRLKEGWEGTTKVWLVPVPVDAALCRVPSAPASAPGGVTGASASSILGCVPAGHVIDAIILYEKFRRTQVHDIALLKGGLRL